MKQTRIIFTIVCLVVGSAAQIVAAGKASILVDTKWLAEHLGDPNLVVLNVASNARDYRRGHIPGARFLWISHIATSNPELSFELPPVAQLDTTLEGLGISNDSRIVLCGVNGNVSPTARVYITLEYLGMEDQTSILDGGFEAWKSSGGAVSTETPVFRRGSFTPHVKRDAIVDAEYVKSRLGMKQFAIVDARAPQFFNGDRGGFPRTGHIPGAHNLYFVTLFDSTDKYLPLDSIKAKFESIGLLPGQEVITYCHVGQTASAVYLGAKQLGYRAHLYDGSFEDWSGRVDLPLESPKVDSLRKN